MESSRIFVGNLNSNIENNQLQDEFSNYGTVLNVEIKSKADFEGNIISKFAYVTVESDRSQISKCVNALNGSSWKGTVLKVEVAKESFLQRLKREREQNLKIKTNKPQVAEKTTVPEYRFERLNSAKEEESSGLHINKSVNETNPYSFSKGISRYDPLRPDHEYLCDRKPMTIESDTKALQNTKFVKVSADLKFSGKSDGFSLLERFSKTSEVKEFIPHNEECNSIEKPIKQEELFENWQRAQCLAKQNRNNVQNVDLYETHHPSYYHPPKLSMKKKFFFIQANDPNLSEGVDWLLTPLTPENLEEFKRVRKELVDLYKLRHLRAKREKTKNKGRKFQKRRNRPNKTISSNS